MSLRVEWECDGCQARRPPACYLPSERVAMAAALREAATLPRGWAPRWDADGGVQVLCPDCARRHDEASGQTRVGP